MSETGKRRRTPVWVIVLLIVSLSANAFVAGLWGKRFFKDRSFENRALHWVERTAERLPEDARDDYMARFDERREEFLAKADAAFASRQAITDAMSAEPYEPAAVRAAQDAARQKFVAMRRVMDEVLANTVDALTAEDRAQVAESWQRRKK